MIVVKTTFDERLFSIRFIFFLESMRLKTCDFDTLFFPRNSIISLLEIGISFESFLFKGSFEIKEGSIGLYYVKSEVPAVRTIL